MSPVGRRRSVAPLALCLLSPVCALGAGSEARLDELSRNAMAALARQQYSAALTSLREGSRVARETGSLRRAALFENLICGAGFAALEYASSLRACGAAVELALQAREHEVAGVAELNRANILFSLGDTRAAEPGVERALGWLKPDSPRRPVALAALGAIHSRRGEPEKARDLLRRAAALAAVSTDRGVEASVQGTLGELELAAGSLDRAESAFLATFRIRKLHKLPQLESAWWKLGSLRLAQGRPAEALRCFQHGLAARRGSRAYFANFVTLHGKARALAALGDRRGARAVYRLALDESRAWRNELAPVEGLEIAADVRLAAIADEFAAVSDPAGEQAWEAFEAVESTRAAGLRRQVLANLSLAGRMPAEYLELIREARNLTRLAAAGSREAVGRKRAVEARISVYESANRALPLAEGRPGARFAAPERIQRQLAGNAVLISFLAGRRSSRVWVLTRDGRASAALPGSAELTRAVESHRAAILSGPDPAASASRLGRLLFSGIPRQLLSRPKWLIVADGPLWSVPWAALPGPGAEGRQFLIETASIELLPSATWIFSRPLASRSGSMLAAGDAIHNRADGRFRMAAVPGPALLSFWVWPWFRPAAGDGPLELPALAGSRREMAAVCQAWTAGPCSAIGGSALTTERLERELAAGPRVLHLATHLLDASETDGHPPGQELGQNLISLPGVGSALLALSLRPDLSRDVIYAGDVSRLTAPGALIVLSACSSGRGVALPGAGLQGFARAWLAAGARGVVGSLWNVRDEASGFFSSFYRELSSGAAPARALRSAQLRAIRTGGVSSQPRSWAAYMLLGKDTE